jgi:hypothetical protein
MHPQVQGLRHPKPPLCPTHQAPAPLSCARPPRQETSKPYNAFSTPEPRSTPKMPLGSLPSTARSNMAISKSRVTSYPTVQIPLRLLPRGASPPCTSP